MANEVNTITLERAQSWATTWRLNSPLKGFLIPKADIEQMYQDQGDVDIRAYLGIDEEGNPHLMLVGVIDNEDQIDADHNKYIYDFTTPCPTMCDPNSQLNNFK